MRLLLLGTCVVMACRPPGLLGSEADLRVTPQTLALEGWVGFPITGEVEVTNASRQTLQVTLSGAEGFERAVTELSLSPAESARVSLTFTTTQPGTFTSELFFTSEEGRSARVSLQVVARVPPPCEAAECEAARFDPVSGACVSAPLAEGSACRSADRCVLDGHCNAGQCLGSFLECDDGNACTLDACSSLSGCLHREVPPAPSADPCLVPRCTAAGTIELGAVVDGTACGPNDCSSARVCISGACTTRLPPEGSVCAEATPCQDVGYCVAGACSRPPPSGLSPAWSFQPGPSLELLNSASARGELAVFSGHAHGDPDDAGSVLWVLGADGGVQGVQELPRASPYRTWRDLAGERIYFLLDNQVLEARSGQTGALEWRVDLVDAVLPSIPGSTRADWAISVLAGVVLPSSRDLALISRRWDWLDPGEPWLTIVSAADGSVKRVFPLPGGVVNGLTGDDFDNIYLAINARAPTHTTRVASYTSLGLQRWSTLITPGTYVRDLKVMRDRLYVTGSNQVFDFASGAAVFTLPVALEVLPVPMLGGWVMAGRSAGELTLYGFDWQGGARFVRPEPDLKEPLLPSAHDAVLFYSGPGEAHVLVGVESSGREAFSCRLEDVRYLSSGRSLRSGPQLVLLRETGPSLTPGIVGHALSGW